MQEGWRLEPVNGREDELRYAGIVYNEMKGAYSSPNRLSGNGHFGPSSRTPLTVQTPEGDPAACRP